MGKIYVITVGEYSDYDIECATVDKELAEAYVKIHPNCRVEEYDDLADTATIDIIDDAKNVVVGYEIDTGNSWGRPFMFDEDFRKTFPVGTKTELHFEPVMKDGKFDLECKGVIVCSDSEKAQKIYYDLQAEYMARLKEIS